MWETDPRDPVPVYEQLANRVRYAVAAGRFGPGDRLPSVRELARRAVVNPNTVVRVYRDLEVDGVLRTEEARGAFVTEEAPALCRAATREIVTRRIARALEEARRAGLDEGEVEEAVRRALAERSPRRRRSAVS